MTERTAKWEAKLWAYICSGNGTHCPSYSNCLGRQRGLYCIDDNIEQFNQLIDCGSQFEPGDHCLGERRGNLQEHMMEPDTVFRLIEKLAEKQHRKGRLSDPPVPIGLAFLADKQRPLEIRRLHLKAYQGAIWYLREGWVIQIKDDGTSAESRFTVFHEVFHILAHCNSNTTPIFRKRGATEGAFNEVLADYFAICILMPQDWVRKKWAEVEDLDRMAEIFDAPKSAMWIRLRGLELV